MPILVPVFAALAIGFAQWRYTSAVDENRRTNEVQDEEVRVATCRGRNSANAAARSDSAIIVDGFRRYTADDPEAQAFIRDDVMPRMSSPTLVDRDCDRNCVLDRADYEDVVPPELMDGGTLPSTDPVASCG